MDPERITVTGKRHSVYFDFLLQCWDNRRKARLQAPQMIESSLLRLFRPEVVLGLSP